MLTANVFTAQFIKTSFTIGGLPCKGSEVSIIAHIMSSFTSVIKLWECLPHAHNLNVHRTGRPGTKAGKEAKSLYLISVCWEVFLELGQCLVSLSYLCVLGGLPRTRPVPCLSILSLCVGRSS